MLLSNLRHFCWTLVLFTYRDHKTIVFPVVSAFSIHSKFYLMSLQTVFACAAAPVESPTRLLYGIFWTWLHLLQACVSNQYQNITEDTINRPWRPLPSGRISQKSAAVMRWLLVPICAAASVAFGQGALIPSLSLTALLIAHNEFGFASHWLTKNTLNSLGYLCFEFGATTIMNSGSQLDIIALQSLLCSCLVILTTIHAQDFSDIDGDVALGRVTLPIYAPSTSRVFTFIALVVWSDILGLLWSIGPRSHLALCGLGGVVGWRFFQFRTRKDDANTYLAYNVSDS
ncbi:Digeranylgeranylglyceryl phosphate synthase [Mycena venus]|uniref:Digeranylgeranylglyceryl phosphate synthase n=1 Tax=Mycena venus TaxID=2733690 RepID=A0A8H6YKK8_9AGAR|nr:Digeranylgeranylglyceryl phosphate synthase [Mycena venus]